jgi:NAD(P)H-dependent FMN reductase
MDTTIRLMLLNGSLRQGSINGAVLATARALAPVGTEALLYQGISGLPHFNPDDDVDPLRHNVVELREGIGKADAVLISTPEYAGSLPGSFKNALDWTVGGASFYERPVGWINASAEGRAQDTYAVLRLVLERAGAKIIEAACRDIPVPRSAVDASGIIGDPHLRAEIGSVVHLLVAAARSGLPEDQPADTADVP